jgi:hypothetical protein
VTTTARVRLSVALRAAAPAVRAARRARAALPVLRAGEAPRARPGPRARQAVPERRASRVRTVRLRRESNGACFLEVQSRNHFLAPTPPLPFTLGSFEPWSLRVGCCPPQLGVACKTIALTSNLGTTSRRLVQLHSERADKVFGTLGATELQRPRLSLSPAVRNLQSKCTRSRTPNKPCLRTRCKFYNSVVQIPTCSREPGPCRDQVLRAHLLPVAQFPSARDSS